MLKNKNSEIELNKLLKKKKGENACYSLKNAHTTVKDKMQIQEKDTQTETEKMIKGFDWLLSYKT